MDEKRKLLSEKESEILQLTNQRTVILSEQSNLSKQITEMSGKLKALAVLYTQDKKKWEDSNKELTAQKER